MWRVQPHLLVLGDTHPYHAIHPLPKLERYTEPNAQAAPLAIATRLPPLVQCRVSTNYATLVNVPFAVEPGDDTCVTTPPLGGINIRVEHPSLVTPTVLLQ